MSISIGLAARSTKERRRKNSELRARKVGKFLSTTGLKFLFKPLLILLLWFVSLYVCPSILFRLMVKFMV